MTQPLSLAALWHDTIADSRALLPLALPVAAAFVLLPGVALDLFGPPLPTTVAGVTPRLFALDLLLPALIGLVAQGATIRLALDRRAGVSRSVGEALAAALRAWPLAVLALALSALAVVPGLALLVVPGLYLVGRLAPVLPLVLDGAGLVAAVERSWALTAGNGWRVIGFTLLVFGWFVVVSIAAGAVGGGVAALLRSVGAAGAGAVVASTLDGLVAAVFTVANAVAVATVYRMLRAS